jgi:hypothetical protein
MAVTQSRACWKCEWYNGTRAVEAYGECRYNPPIQWPTQSRKWPMCLGSDWCGHYKPQQGNETTT